MISRAKGVAAPALPDPDFVDAAYETTSHETTIALDSSRYLNRTIEDDAVVLAERPFGFDVPLDAKRRPQVLSAEETGTQHGHEAREDDDVCTRQSVH